MISDETRRKSGSVPLREHLEFRIAVLEEKTQIQVNSAERALELAKEIADDQREASNYVRDQLREQAASLVSREAFDLRTGALDRRADTVLDRCITLEKSNANLQGRLWAFGVGLGVFFTLLQFALKVMTK